MTFDDAPRLDDERLDSARRLSALRPPSAKAVRGFDFDVLDASGQKTASRRLIIRDLGDGLEFHDAFPVTPSTDGSLGRETLVSVAGGAATVAYTSEMSLWLQIAQAVVPHRLRLVDGDPFAGSQAWTYEIRNETDDVDTETCSRGRTVPATEIHPALTGTATRYDCERKSDLGSFAIKWYLPDYARYFPGGAREGQQDITTLRITRLEP